MARRSTASLVLLPTPDTPQQPHSATVTPADAASQPQQSEAETGGALGCPEAASTAAARQPTAWPALPSSAPDRLSPAPFQADSRLARCTAVVAPPPHDGDLGLSAHTEAQPEAVDGGQSLSRDEELQPFDAVARADSSASLVFVTAPSGFCGEEGIDTPALQNGGVSRTLQAMAVLPAGHAHPTVPSAAWPSSASQPRACSASSDSSTPAFASGDGATMSDAPDPEGTDDGAAASAGQCSACLQLLSLRQGSGELLAGPVNPDWPDQQSAAAPGRSMACSAPDLGIDGAAAATPGLTGIGFYRATSVDSCGGDQGHVVSMAPKPVGKAITNRFTGGCASCGTDLGLAASSGDPLPGLGSAWKRWQALLPHNWVGSS